MAKKKKKKASAAQVESSGRKETPEQNETIDIYDKVPYGDEPFPSTYPQTLAAAAALFGLAPVHPERCRVLELGAARGNNLIGMAYSLPNSQFVGIELSANQVKAGKELIANLELKNIELVHSNILKAGAKLGKFDYIVSHGTLSWVPPEVRKKMFELCGELLTPNGVAYLSYNTYPGWKVRDIFRDLMLFESSAKDSPEEKVKHARLSLEILTRILADNQSTIAQHIREELPQFKNRPGWYFIHDFIADYNQPFYFFEIMREVDRVGLQYLGDTELSMMTFHGLTPQAQSVLHSLSHDLIRFEQYSDVARNRFFRRTLLCRKGIELRRKVPVEALLDFHFASRFALPPEPSPGRPNAKRFRHLSGGAIDVGDTNFSAALELVAGAWPRALSAAEIFNTLKPQAPEHARSVLEGLLQGIFANMIEVRLSPGPAANTLPERPVASRLARIQAQRSNVVTSLLHYPVQLEDFDREVIVLLDGSNTDRGLLEPPFPDQEIGKTEVRRLAASLEKLVKEGLIHQP